MVNLFSTIDFFTIEYERILKEIQYQNTHIGVFAPPIGVKVEQLFFWGGGGGGGGEGDKPIGSYVSPIPVSTKIPVSYRLAQFHGSKLAPFQYYSCTSFPLMGIAQQ